MEKFLDFLKEVKWVLPNWAWIAISLVVAIVLIITICTVAASSKRKRR